MRTDLSSAFLRSFHKKQGGWAGWAALAGGVIGAVGSNSAAKKASQAQSTTTNTPWSGVQPYLSRGYSGAEGLLNQGYPQDTQALLRARGLFGSPVTQEAQNLAGSTMRGDYLNSNPFLNDSVSQAMGMAKSQINSQFAGNNYGSSAHQEWLGKGLMNAALPQLSQNYENERGRQFAALSQAPALAGMDYQNLGAMQQADFMPWDWLQRYQQTIGGLQSGGGTSTTQNPYFTNPANSALGGALLGNQVYNQFQQPSTYSATTSNAYGSPNDMSASLFGF